MPSKNRLCIYSSLILLLMSTSAFVEERPIGPFSSNGLANWQSKSFLGLTDYQLVLDQDDRVLKADSNGQASALICEQRIDLQKTPWINWRWKIKEALNTTAETTKAGDDYAARIYVIVDGGVFRWRSKTLNYVWSSRSGDIENWPNAYLPKNAMMMAVRNADHDTDTWYTEKRNVFEDLKQVFGKEIRYIDAIAIMTDTDNTKQTVTAWYGDLVFTDK